MLINRRNFLTASSALAFSGLPPLAATAEGGPAQVASAPTDGSGNPACHVLSVKNADVPAKVRYERVW